MIKWIFLFVVASSCLFGCQKEHKKVSEDTVILVQPFEGMDNALVDTVLTTFQEVYGVKAYAKSAIAIPSYSFVDIKSPRYRADSLIRFLRDSIYPQHANVDHILGLIDEDISTTKYSNFKKKEVKSPSSKYQDWGIYGLGFCPGKTAIVSTHRLKKGTSKENFILRLKKVSCHELGHNFGLPHCPNTNCIMQDAAETIKTIDNVALQLCEACRLKIGLPAK
ncbi:archaemetzincin [Parvicella tangerina]|uniref:Archaemetzincin n=1 Tax=Parvicella tangerina TaxID=2829795 RepID=A0A916JL80_9FLAO|nr:archaemetzincin [Parvicella tangerina]CAG5079602.1 hypothetical protein CRYO30217_00986 [Parvicella tangerina]